MLDVIRRPCLVFIVWMTYSTLAICSASASPAVYECRPIHAAVHAGDLKRVKEILDKDPKQIDAQVEFRHFSFGTKKVDDTPLSEAAAEGNVEMVKLLLDRGARVQCGMDDYHWCYPIHEAAINGNVEVARLLLEKGARVNTLGGWLQSVEDSQAWTDVSALHQAVSRGHLAMAKFLLEQGAKVNACATNGGTPLHVAAEQGDLPLVKLLISKGADSTIKNKEGETPAQVAQVVGLLFPSRRSAYENVAKFLVETEHRPDTIEEKKNLLEWVSAQLKMPAPSKNDALLRFCETTPERNQFWETTKKLIASGDPRVLKVIDTRAGDFDRSLMAELASDIYRLNLNAPETRALAKKWLAIPLPPEADRPEIFENNQQALTWQTAHEKWDAEVERHFWCCMYLLKGNSADQQLGLNEMRKLFDEIGLGTKITASHRSVYFLGTDVLFKVEELLKLNRKDARELACRLGVLAGYFPERLQATRLLFNAGCEEALKSLTGKLRAPIIQSQIGYQTEQVNGKEIRHPFGNSDTFVAEFLGQQIDFASYRRTQQLDLHPEWSPPGFTYDITQTMELRKQKREQLAQWLEKKFAEIKAGKCPPLSLGKADP
jgi:ankyrin repeat protein